MNAHPDKRFWNVGSVSVVLLNSYVQTALCINSLKNKEFFQKNILRTPACMKIKHQSSEYILNSEDCEHLLAMAIFIYVEFRLHCTQVKTTIF